MWQINSLQNLQTNYSYSPTCATARCRWEDNIKMALKEMGWQGVGRIHLVGDRYKAGFFLKM
jgi:hypothetical protein